MRIPLTFVLLALIVLEFLAFAAVAQALGILAALGLILLSVVTGGLLLRMTGLAMMARLRAGAATGRLPPEALAENGARTLAALLLILPGFLTDIAALLVFIAPLRRALMRAGRPASRSRAAPPHPGSPVIVDLDASQYAAKPSASSRADSQSPWRGGPRPGNGPPPPDSAR